MTPVFKTEAELRQFASINGYGPKATEKLLQEWKKELNKPVSDTSNIEIKSDLDIDDGY